jgi:hypothetical protein
VYPDLLQKFDLIVGVSGGSMITAGLATGALPSSSLFILCFSFFVLRSQPFSLSQDDRLTS